ncbi:MAG: protein kinase [Thermodesulfobacteriota bacterium]|nr:protein kinase [Thermodesulfobacteriota bacterium]
MEQIPGYQIINKIGEGGMAAVYKGVQISLNRLVAIKLLLKNMTDRSSAMERFNRESMIIARLNNPNIIHVIDRGFTTEGMPYFVMEYVEGTDLENAIKARSLDYNRKLDLIIQICKALSHAHKNGVVHRDIKPSNVIIDEDGNARVLDFGIAQFYEDENSDFRLTQTGTFMGTLEYMSPEQQHSAGNVTALSDLYSLGVVMYELFVGVKPTGRFQLPTEINPSIPEPLQEVIMNCLETDPSNRLASANEVKDRLLKLLKGAHLKTDQKNRAAQGISNIKEQFVLLDVIKDEPHGSVHLYEDRVNQNLLVIKKRPRDSTGFIEAKLLTSLRHKNIAEILGTSRNENFFIVVMEYLSGGNLQDRLFCSYQTDEFLVVAQQICEGLSFAHRNRIVHGNIRPSNFLFTDSGHVKITDFGLDEHYGDEEDRNNWYNPNCEPTSVQTDVLATGVIFYQMLTGSLPKWKGNSLSLDKSFKSLPPELQALVTAMVSTDTSKRYSSFEEVIADINAFSSSVTKTAVSETRTKIMKKRLKTASFTRPMKLIPILLLLLFCISALVYLIFGKNISTFKSTLIDSWNWIVEHVTMFFT